MLPTPGSYVWLLTKCYLVTFDKNERFLTLPLSTILLMWLASNVKTFDLQYLWENPHCIIKKKICYPRRRQGGFDRVHMYTRSRLPLQELGKSTYTESASLPNFSWTPAPCLNSSFSHLNKVVYCDLPHFMVLGFTDFLTEAGKVLTLDRVQSLYQIAIFWSSICTN